MTYDFLPKDRFRADRRPPRRKPKGSRFTPLGITFLNYEIHTPLRTFGATMNRAFFVLCILACFGIVVMGAALGLTVDWALGLTLFSLGFLGMMGAAKLRSLDCPAWALRSRGPAQPLNPALLPTDAQVRDFRRSA